MAGSPSELLRTSDHLKGVQEATDAHWAAVRAQMGKRTVAGAETEATVEDEPKALPEPVYSD